jgi:hypothetical protein
VDDDEDIHLYLNDLGNLGRFGSWFVLQSRGGFSPSAEDQPDVVIGGARPTCRGSRRPD